METHTNMNKTTRTSRTAPMPLNDASYLHSSFANGQCFDSKKTGRLPAMGWNSWNAFGSHNTEALTKEMADRMIALELDKLGYQYLVLDDGCYRSERVDGKLTNEPDKFPNGFRKLADYLHERGLKFGMYNDIGTHLCAGSAVGTCGYEDTDANSYASWNIDFLKVDNCYYLWDNATFSNTENARYTYAPHIKSLTIKKDSFASVLTYFDAKIIGNGATVHKDGYITNIGTFDGTNVGPSPVGAQSSELHFEVEVPFTGDYELLLEYATGKEPGVGEWLQIAVSDNPHALLSFDGLLPATESPSTFRVSDPIRVHLNAGIHTIRLMNHRRQENVLQSYAAMFYALKEAAPERDIVLSICEWGKTQPQNWGYKVGDSWRILNDICFQVGSDKEVGTAAWTDPNSPSITSQYDKSVIMDEFAGLDRGWNDPDMLVIGLNGINLTMNKTHMTMWCMMNCPLMLGCDLRCVEKGDDIWNIIANPDVIALNQDPLGIPAKRVFCSLVTDHPDQTYITNHDRFDILAKPLSDGSLALSFINLSEKEICDIHITLAEILNRLGTKASTLSALAHANRLQCFDVWSKETQVISNQTFTVSKLNGYDNITIRISPLSE